MTIRSVGKGRDLDVRLVSERLVLCARDMSQSTVVTRRSGRHTHPIASTLLRTSPAVMDLGQTVDCVHPSVAPTVTQGGAVLPPGADLRAPTPGQERPQTSYSCRRYA